MAPCFKKAFWSACAYSAEGAELGSGAAAFNFAFWVGLLSAAVLSSSEIEPQPAFKGGPTHKAVMHRVIRAQQNIFAI